MDDKYGVGDDPYCYPGTTILRNKLNLQNEDLLDQAERELSEIAASTIGFEVAPYSLDTLQHIHRTLVADLYDWAGVFARSKSARTRPYFAPRSASFLKPQKYSLIWPGPTGSLIGHESG